MEILGASGSLLRGNQQDGLQIVRAKVTGNFPGSPINLSYRFRLERGLISLLEVTA